MAQLLAIIAHPMTDKMSTSIELYKNFIESYKQTNPNDTIVERNVSEEPKLPFDDTALSIYNKKSTGATLTRYERAINNARQSYVDEFVQSDKYVFVNPMYNFFLPAEMKSYMDIIMQIPDTFEYNDQSKLQGNLLNKKVLHLQSSGDCFHSADKKLQELDLGDKYLKTVFNIMGIDDYQSIFVEGMDFDPKNSQSILNRGYQSAKQLARVF
ncbi:FMN-dependent NADH-azoreductase 2 [Companilactobacillus tucceti DSM 20183]|uniref:FMN dependent NADH:quinone oxidoreductase n=1 Tax=Companilactobacillus tucceti DSM 20183 TaxID=1423811 RepID=A0A0R1IZ58_9LACO|nr:NAD(P)H-dependent oxidoreductase [Companilactobacillus tucceti]KRK64438.1 FMN-dependent NADH-azoreductase 2 [Companilactobacillus tucceti DSM 20183]